jgi:xylonate dehydratase
MAEQLATAPEADREVIRSVAAPLKPRAGFVVLSGNLFDAAVMKASVISDEFRRRYLQAPGAENVVTLKAIVFEGPEDYHGRINDPALDVDANCILVIRNCGPVGYPGSAEVVNMLPPDRLVREGITQLPTMGDGRQSGTSASPSILNVSPEAAVGGGLALLRTGDLIRLDLNIDRVDLLVDEAEFARRRAALKPPTLINQTPWQQTYREQVGQLSTGACLEPATVYLDVLAERGMPRHSH